MRKITDIILHCSATRENSDYTLEQLTKDHKKRGFKKIGYHFFITKDGTIHKGRNISEIGAHVQGHNKSSIGICYEGGLNTAGKAKDTRTEKQKIAIIVTLATIIEELSKFQSTSNIKIKGHRDYSPDLNGNGVIEKHEYMKECPCFDAFPEYENIIR